MRRPGERGRDHKRGGLEGGPKERQCKGLTGAGRGKGGAAAGEENRQGEGRNGGRRRTGRPSRHHEDRTVAPWRRRQRQGIPLGRPRVDERRALAAFHPVLVVDRRKCLAKFTKAHRVSLVITAEDGGKGGDRKGEVGGGNRATRRRMESRDPGLTLSSASTHRSFAPRS